MARTSREPLFPLRADQWIMLGVVALGGAAVYLMTRARPRTLETMEDARANPALRRVALSLR